jgi:hypothetical protein
MTTTNDRPDLSSEGAPAIDKTMLVKVKPKLISGHETHMGFESRTYLLIVGRNVTLTLGALSPGVKRSEREAEIQLELQKGEVFKSRHA